MSEESAVLILRAGDEVLVARRDGQGTPVAFTVAEWDAFVAATRLQDLDSGRLPVLRLPGHGDAPRIDGHPFEPATFPDAWPGICGHLMDGLPCGHFRDEHLDQGDEE